MFRVDQPKTLHHLTLHFVAVGTLVANAAMIPGGMLCTKASQAAAKPAQSCGVWQVDEICKNATACCLEMMNYSNTKS